MVHRAFTLLGCTHALLLATASTDLHDANGRTALQHGEAQGRKATTTLQAEAKGPPAVAELIRRHAAPPQPAAAMPATPPDASKPAVSSAASLPPKIYELAGRGELRKVVKWLRKGGSARSALRQPSTGGSRPSPCYTSPQPTTTLRS